MNESFPIAKTTVLLILGMHRSGTSALTRVLNLLGCMLPGDILGADESNPMGHWESVRAIEINDELLGSLGRSWNDVRNLPSNWLLLEEAELARRQIRSFVKDNLLPGRLWALKEPRLCRLAPLWIEVLEEEGVDVRVIVPIRHPDEVASSLARRNGIIAERSDLLWIQHVLEAEASTRAKPRVMTHFDELMADWRALALRIAAEVGVEWPNDIESAGAEIDEFLRPELRHGQVGLPGEGASTTHASPIASVLYGQLLNLRGERAWEAIANMSAGFAGVSILYSKILDADLQDRNELIRRLGAQDELLRAAAPLRGQLDNSRRESSEQQAIFASVNQTLAIRDQEIGDVRRALEERDSHFDDLRRALEDRDSQIGDLRRVLEERDSQIGDLDRRLQVLGKRVDGLRKAQAEREHEIANIVSSHSWKITLPLRELRRWLTAPRTQFVRYARALRRSLESIRRSQVPGGPANRPLIPRDIGAAEKYDLSSIFDSQSYLERNQDVLQAGVDPFEHFVLVGWREGRNPHPLFDVRWYLDTYPDVRDSGINPLQHYIASGAAELRNPHRDFDARFYVAEHPEAAANPLAYHIRHGLSQGWPTHRGIDIADYLPRRVAGNISPQDVVVDVIIPVYRGLAETRRCLESVLADVDRVPGRILVIDDCSPEPELSAWLSAVAETGQIVLARNETNLGFVATVNRGMREAGRNDVVLLNSDTEVPNGWLGRLAAQAYSGAKIASVTPFSNNATICSYPLANDGGPLPKGYSAAEIDLAFRAANNGRSVEIPTAVGFCMYIRRSCLDEVGLFDVDAFGRGYGEENDFCMRALAAGWRHLLACDAFVFHAGEVSFGKHSPERNRSWEVLVGRYPDYPSLFERHIAGAPTMPVMFAATVSLFAASAMPTILMISHNLGGGTARHVDDLICRLRGLANVLLLHTDGPELALEVPSMPGHPTLRLPYAAVDQLVALLEACELDRIHIHHWIDLDTDLSALVRRLRVPFDFTVHDYFSICPRITLLSAPNGVYCGEPDSAQCDTCIRQAPAHGATDITSWRAQHKWLLTEAARVICPSQDVRARLDRFVRLENAIVVPHEPVLSEVWPVNVPALAKDEPLRVAVLGAFGLHKGRRAFEDCVEISHPSSVKFSLIGFPDRPFARDVARKIFVHGPYEEWELPGLIGAAMPHVLWFPQPWPETYSYTLSAAIDSGLPIVANGLGALPERLAGRPLTWIVDDPSCEASHWLQVFAEVANSLRSNIHPVVTQPRPLAAPFYPDAYLSACRPKDCIAVMDGAGMLPT